MRQQHCREQQRAAKRRRSDTDLQLWASKALKKGLRQYTMHENECAPDCLCIMQCKLTVLLLCPRKKLGDGKVCGLATLRSAIHALHVECQAV